MLFRRQVNFFLTSTPTAIAIFTILLISSCTIPKHYQAKRPFTFRSTVDLQSDLSKTEKQELKQELLNQMDDSLKVRTVLAVGFPELLFNRLSRPPVFDSLYVDRSRGFMAALLRSQGFFNPTITDTFRIDTIRRSNFVRRMFRKPFPEQQRVYVTFRVTPGVALRLDSIAYDLRTPGLQALAAASQRNSLLKKDDRYSINNISAELDRLLNVFRDSGYYKLTKEDLYAEHDTVVAALIDPNLDPFEQIALLDSLQKKRDRPTINIVIRQRDPKDSSHLLTYRWGRINVYPDKPISFDTTAIHYDSSRVGRYTFFRTADKFRLGFIARNIAARPGSMYKQSDYYNTINKFTNLGAWQQVDMKVIERPDSSRILDADVLLYPAAKQSMNVSFEASRNETDILGTSSLFGIALNFGIRNRNAFRESIATSSNARIGVELGRDFIQTLQGSLSHTIYFPRFITPFKVKHERSLVAPKTFFNLSAQYTDRRQFFSSRTINLSWGYEWTKRNHSWQYIPFNFEYTWTPVRTDSFEHVLTKIPSLAQAFNDGLIIGQQLAYTTGTRRLNKQHIFKARLEESGAIVGFIKRLDQGALRRFVKLDLEYRYFITQAHSQWALRALGGYGYAYGRSGDGMETNLPFYKAYFGGGPYTMRAWQVRRLGLGSSKVFDSLSSGLDRFGDMKLEGDVEYRFDIGKIAGIKVKSAFFADVGNIWGKAFDKNLQSIDSTQFNLSRLYADLAVGAGTSLRFDFDFFLIRLDWAYQIKNPAVAEESYGWFRGLKVKSGQFQLGIGMPF